MVEVVENPHFIRPDEVSGDSFCCRCGEAFPVKKSKDLFVVREITPLVETSFAVIRVYGHWLGHAKGRFLCGQCYIDEFHDRGER